MVKVLENRPASRISSGNAGAKVSRIVAGIATLGGIAITVMTLRVCLHEGPINTAVPAALPYPGLKADAGQNGVPEAKARAQAKRPARTQPEKAEAGRLDLLEEVRRAYTGESITCEKTANQVDTDPTLYALYFNHASHSLNDPNTSLRGIEPPIALLELAESEEDAEKVFQTLEYLDSIGVAKAAEGGRWMAKVQTYAMETDMYSEGPFYPAECIGRAGNAYMLAARLIQARLDRALDNDGEGMEALATRMPENFKEILFDRLSIALFEPDAAFSPEFADGIIQHLSDDNKWEFFERLYDYVLLNGSYRENARAVQNFSKNRTVRRGIERIFEEIERAESE